MYICGWHGEVVWCTRGNNQHTLTFDGKTVELSHIINKALTIESVFSQRVQRHTPPW